MSYRVLKPYLWAANNMARGGSVVLAASAPSPIAAEPRMTSRSTSTLPRARRTEAAISQKRKLFHSLLSHPFERCSSSDFGNLGLFHQTPARRSEVVIIDAGHVILGCLVVLGSIAGSVALVRHLTGYSTLPPHTWARTANEQTRNEVEMTMSMAFNMARNAPMHRRNKNLRDATFQVPHELAKLNSKAPNFHLEDLGPMAAGKIPWDVGRSHSSTDGPPLDAKTETRAFLYFPNGSPKATAIFLAVNSELKYPKQVQSQRPGYSRKPLALLQAFRVVYADWERNRPSLIDRIVVVDRLPVICNFQEHVFGSLYYPIIGIPGSSMMALTPLDITDFSLKTSFL